jgi:hypothetical protein
VRLDPYDRQELRRLASAVQMRAPGPWHQGAPSNGRAQIWAHDSANRGQGLLVASGETSYGNPARVIYDEIADYFIAVSPDRILALLDELEGVPDVDDVAVLCAFCERPIDRDEQGYWTSRTQGDEARGVPNDEWGRICLGDQKSPRPHEPATDPQETER